MGNRIISRAIWDKNATQVIFSKTKKNCTSSSGDCNLWSLKNLRVLIYPKLHEKNHVITCLYMQKFDLRFSSFTSQRALFVTAPWSRPQMTTLIKIGQNFARWILVDKKAAARNLFIENWSLLSFAFWTLHVFPLPPLTEIELPTRLKIGHTAGRRAAIFFLSNNRLWQNENLLEGWATRGWRLHTLYFRWYQAFFPALQSTE